jgi:cysteine desulfurase
MEKYFLESGEIYLDNAATSVKSVEMARKYAENVVKYGFNPMSSHSGLKLLKESLQKSRERLLSYFNLSPLDFSIVYCSGSTEALNLIIKGLFFSSSKRRIITSKLEHKAVLETVQYLEMLGAEVIYIPHNNEGVLQISALEKLVNNDTLCVILMHVNNETGEINDVEDVSVVCGNFNVPFICDTTQSIGKEECDFSNFSAFVGSAHKFGAPFGTGFLIMKRTINIERLIHGGGQEASLRAGTHNLPGIMTMIDCLEQGYQNPDISFKKLVFSELGLNMNHRIGKNTSPFIYAFQVNDIEAFIQANPKFIIGRGSACNSGLIQSSHVYSSLGYNNNVIRISF